MGEVYVELEKYADRVLAKEGRLEERALRSQKVKVLTDTGSTMSVLPEDLVDTLGLERRGKAIVTYADERKEEQEIAGVITVRVGGRSMETNCVVGPWGSEPLLGQIVLEQLDMNADSKVKETILEIVEKIKRQYEPSKIILTPEEVREQLEIGDQFLREILDKGEVLYET